MKKEFLASLRIFADAQGYTALLPLIDRALQDPGIPEAIDISLSAAMIAEMADWRGDKRQASTARSLASTVWMAVEQGVVQRGELRINAARCALEACA